MPHQFLETKLHVWLLKRKFLCVGLRRFLSKSCCVFTEWKSTFDLSDWNPVCGRTSNWRTVHYVTSSSSNVNTWSLMCEGIFYPMLRGMRKRIPVFADSQSSPACSSDKNVIKRKVEYGALVELCWRENCSNLRKTSPIASLPTTISHWLTGDRTPTYGEMPATKHLSHALKPDVHLNPWFPECVPRTDPPPVPRGSVDTFL
jgi:hypothetical protein